MPTPSIEEVIGSRIREGRDEVGMTQSELGQALAEYTGRIWPAPAVSAAESGRRDFKAADLAAFALVLQRPITFFVSPKTSNQSMRVGVGQATPSALRTIGVRAGTGMPSAASGSLDSWLASVSTQLSAGCNRLVEQLDEVQGTVKGLSRNATALGRVPRSRRSWDER